MLRVTPIFPRVLTCPCPLCLIQFNSQQNWFNLAVVLEANGYEILGRTQKLQSKSLAEAEQGLNDYELAKRLYGRHDIMSRHSRAGECVPCPAYARLFLCVPSLCCVFVSPFPVANLPHPSPSDVRVSHVPGRLFPVRCAALCRKFKYLSGNMNLAHQYLDTDRKRWKAEEDKRKAREDMVHRKATIRSAGLCYGQTPNT